MENGLPEAMIPKYYQSVAMENGLPEAMERPNIPMIPIAIPRGPQKTRIFLGDSHPFP